VIGGLWDVSDASTAETMKFLYRGLESGKAPPDALHEAKLAMIHSYSRYAKPFYWAPFQVYVRSHS
jgi:CHAT domain-containing protein